MTSRLSSLTTEIRTAMDANQRATAFHRASFAAIMTATSFSSVANVDRDTVCRSLFPDDTLAQRLLQRGHIHRAPVDPGAASAWEPNTSVVSLAFLQSLAPYSAAARLIARGASFPVDTAGNVMLPRRATGPIEMPWVGEGEPIPLTADGIAGVQFPQPKKVAILLALLRTFMRRPYAAAAVDMLLREAAAVSLDSAYFSDQAATADSIAGLLYDAVDAGSGTGSDPKDTLATLARKVCAGGSGQVCFVTGSGRAAELGILLPELKADIFGSVAVSDDTVIGIDPVSFAHGVGAPEISASGEAVIHMETEAAEIVSGTGPATAAPVRSMWQTDAISYRSTIGLTYVARRSGAVQYVAGLGW